MNEFEYRVRHTARQLPYPATPALRRQWHGQAQPKGLYMRRLAAMIALLVVVVMVTPLRAAVLDWLRIGAVTLFFGDAPTEIPPLPSLLDLAGETTLDEARRRVDFALRLPAGVGPPDHVYWQSDTIIAVWQASGDRSAIAFYQIGGDEYSKLLRLAHNTEVNDQPAVWTDVPHVLLYRPGGREDVTRQAFLVEGHVLIWEDNDITYRLESSLSLADAVAIAESLH